MNACVARTALWAVCTHDCNFSTWTLALFAFLFPPLRHQLTFHGCLVGPSYIILYIYANYRTHNFNLWISWNATIFPCRLKKSTNHLFASSEGFIWKAWNSRWYKILNIAERARVDMYMCGCNYKRKWTRTELVLRICNKIKSIRWYFKRKIETNMLNWCRYYLLYTLHWDRNESCRSRNSLSTVVRSSH